MCLIRECRKFSSLSKLFAQSDFPLTSLRIFFFFQIIRSLISFPSRNRQARFFIRPHHVSPDRVQSALGWNFQWSHYLHTIVREWVTGSKLDLSLQNTLMTEGGKLLETLNLLLSICNHPVPSTPCSLIFSPDGMWLVFCTKFQSVMITRTQSLYLHTGFFLIKLCWLYIALAYFLSSDASLVILCSSVTSWNYMLPSLFSGNK